MRAAIKSLGKHVANALPPATLAGVRSVVLCYHSVHPEASLDSVTPRRFDAHLNWLAEHCDVVPLREIKRVASSTARPRVAITFDDGYRDNYEFAFPSLMDHGFTATFFVIAGFLEGDRAVRGRLARSWRVSLDEMAPMSWEDARAMSAEGMEFGSHTWGHVNLARLDDRSAFLELAHSRELIQERLGENIDAVAYPFGKPKRHVTARTISFAARAGYHTGVLVLPRGVRTSDSPLRIPRLVEGETSIQRLAAEVAGAIDGRGVLHELAPAWLDQFLFPDPVEPPDPREM